MFDLDTAIADWRRQLAVGGVNTPEVLNELESHLREDMEQQTRAGCHSQQAFEAAVRRIGEADVLRSEFETAAGASATVERRVKHAILTLAGIPNPNPCPAMSMNPSPSNTGLEVGWATYLRAAAFLLPAASIWTLSLLFLFPKLQQICKEAGVAMPSILQATVFFAQHGVLICGALVCGLVLLEWRSSGWPRYRRASVGIAVFVLNSAVLMLITTMVVLALLAAPALMSHAR